MLASIWKVAYEGLTMMTFPVRTAGAILLATKRRGKFQGIIAPTTPMGVYRMMTVCMSSSSTISSGNSMLDISRIHRTAASVSKAA